LLYGVKRFITCENFIYKLQSTKLETLLKYSFHCNQDSQFHIYFYSCSLRVTNRYAYQVMNYKIA